MDLRPAIAVIEKRKKKTTWASKMAQQVNGLAV